MRLERLVLDRFRNYTSESVDLRPGLNFVVGANAQGKTNLLEAVYCLGGLGSPRAETRALIQRGQEAAVLHGRVRRGRRNIDIDLELRAGRAARILVNGASVIGPKVLSETVTTVFFGPDELSLVKGSPDTRRKFLDDLLVKMRPTRQSTRRTFERVLKQRNAVLRSLRRGDSADPEALEVWDDAFVRAGAELAAARLAALAALAPLADKRYQEVAGGGRLELGYGSSWLPEHAAAEALTDPATATPDRLAAAIEDRLGQLRRAELERGTTLVGPQRDDVLVLLASAAAESGELLDARTYASQGDQRTCALALKLGELDLLTEALDESPILLLDDVFSELDADRRAWLASAVHHVEQTLLTSAEPLDSTLLEPASVLNVVRGSVKSGG